jgi:methionyl-tRNA formyltransferase
MFRALFLGTPAFAVPCLDALTEIATVVHVVCQPDRPRGRGQDVQMPATKERALALGIPVHQPTKLKDGSFAAWVHEQQVDVALVVAYGCVNVHASLLPKYRGAAPINWAIVRGEAETGVTLMQMDAGLDTGAVLERFPLAINENETTQELSERLAALGALAVRKGLPKHVAGGYTPTPQDHERATLAPMLSKDDGHIRWNQRARAVHDHVRGMFPWPGAFVRHRGKVIKVIETRVVPEAQGAAGRVLFADKHRVLVGCAEGAISLERVQLEGKKPVRGGDWFIGRGVAEGDQLE